MPVTGDAAMIALRSSGVIGPRREDGGRIMVRPTIEGMPLSSSIETSASPTPSWVIDLLGREVGIGPEGLGGDPHRLLLARRVGAERVLHAVARAGPAPPPGMSCRVLRHEVDADALRAHELHHLLDLVDQRLGRVLEQEVRLVEEEHELWLVGIADLGQVLEELREQPEQEGRVEPRARHQLVGGEHRDDAAAVGRRPHQVG